MAFYGLDLSAHNGALDFDAIKHAGNEFVILRAGYGWGSDQKDPNFEAYYAAAKSAGLKVGAYHYSYARNASEAKAEADCFLNWIKGKVFEMPVYIDMEDADAWKRNNGNPSGSDQAHAANAFMQRVQDAGYYVGIYSSTSWFDGYLTGLSKAFTRWIANWGSNDGAVHGTFEPLHQYTSVYTLGGKRFDRNVCYKDFTSEIKAAGLNGFQKTAAAEIDMEAWMMDHLGKFINPDSVYGYQCVDVFKQLALDAGMNDGAKSLGGDGYAHQIWYRRSELGYLDYFDEVPADKIAYGDVVIFGKGGETPDSHVGICAGLSSGGLFVFGQNQGGTVRPGEAGSACNVIELKRDTLLGGLRLKKKKAAAPVTKKSNEELATEVLAGKWGDGADRKARLSAAGYDYAAVQALVNVKLSRKSVEEIAREVLAGKWGNGSDRVNRLRAAGYDPASVQSRVNALCGAKSIEQIAREVIAGKWGNGSDRVNRLRAAGYNPQTVQNEVNKLMR